MLGRFSVFGHPFIVMITIIRFIYHHACGVSVYRVVNMCVI